jgi:tRNA nucleotidyltransferase/poly(A) polymerase
MVKYHVTIDMTVGCSPLQVQLRCAGGWVRDKLLGRDSKDIDIALDTMLGEEFGRLLLPILEVAHCNSS